jgi:hypothetical protein
MATALRPCYVASAHQTANLNPFTGRDHGGRSGDRGNAMTSEAEILKYACTQGAAGGLARVSLCGFVVGGPRTATSHQASPGLS